MLAIADLDDNIVRNSTPARSRYPFPIREIHQIELTSRCNLRCKYCPSPKLPRPKIDMSWDTFEAAMKLVKHYVDAGTQTELSLTGIGEALLHPNFVEALIIARDTIGDRPLVFSTNGLLLTDELCAKIAPYRPLVYVSTHRPERAGLAIEAAKRHGILAGVNTAFATSAFNWAGQVDNWFVSAPKTPCEYLRAGWGVILADGRVTTCCLDADGSGTVGDVHTPPAQLALKPYGHCKSCHMSVPQ